MNDKGLRSFRPGFIALAAMLCVLGMAQPVAAQYQNYFGKNKVRYTKFKWSVYHAPHFDVWYYPEEEHLLEKVISLAESAYDSLSQDLDFQIQQPTPLIIYKTHSDFLQTNIISNFIPEGVGAFATPNFFRMVMPIDMPDPELYKLIRHELTHIFQYHILFSGSLGKSLTRSPPQWFMEGMASYFADDETAADRMYLIDAVVNDSLPPITEGNVSGFFAYRYGHATFDFIEDRWGKDGLQDFLYEFRNTLGARVGRAVERAFRISPEDFDAEFRRWLRDRYLPTFEETGEPSDFGRPFRTTRSNSQETSPVASPSGDLVAAFSTFDRDLDVVLFDGERRVLMKNLTEGLTDSAKFQNLLAQYLTLGRRMGRDLAFSPDGNQIASFASRREAGRTLVLIDVVKGGIDRIIDMEVEQQMSPAWSPDGRTLAFTANSGGLFDVFLMDLETLEIRNLTNDPVFDGSPTFSPDGRSIVVSSVVGEFSQLFRIDLETGERAAVMQSEANDVDAVYAPDGSEIFFTSDRDGADNIYGINVTSGEVKQYTNAITGCSQPTVIEQPDGRKVLVYTGYWKGRFDLYQTELDNPIGEIRTAEVVTTDVPAPADSLEEFEPDIQITLDEANKEAKKGFKLFLEDAGGSVGVDTNQTFLGQIYLVWGDFFGDRRLVGLFSTVSSFSNFNVLYEDLSRRNIRSLSLFDDRQFYFGGGCDPFTGLCERGEQALQITGAMANLTHPFGFTTRATVGVGYMYRDINYQSFVALDPDIPIEPDAPVVEGPDGTFFLPVIEPRKDDYPVVQASYISDNSVMTMNGPHSGHRFRVNGFYAPSFSEGGTLMVRGDIDARKYFPMTRRSLFALRLWAGAADGIAPTPYWFGSYDTMRGYEFREFSGDRAFFANIEMRFPLIDLLAFPVFAFEGIFARVFVDIGGAWYDGVQDFNFWDGDENKLDDGVASYGFGFTVRFFGMNLNWDIATPWDFKDSGETKTTFWIGQRF